MSRRMPGLSICIPNWNHRNFLARSVASALRARQVLADHGVDGEVLVVDDYSRDGSLKMLLVTLLQEGIEHVRVIAKPENQGLASARNTALEASRYRFVCFLDADNELIAENAFMFFRAIHETGAALVYGNLLKTYEGNPVGLLSNELINASIYVQNYIDAFSYVDAETIIGLGGYYGKHAAAHEDWELLLHLMAEGERIVFVPAVLGLYHISSLSMISTTNYDHSRMHRVFNQRGTGLPLDFNNRLIYYPDIGYI